MITIMKDAKRVARGMVPLLLAKNLYLPMLYGLKIAQAITVGMWSDSRLNLKQVDGIGVQFAQLLYAANIKNLDQLIHADPGKIELVT